VSARRRSHRRGLAPALFLVALALVLACDPDNRPQSIDSQTNWLSFCQIDAQCGSLHCVCGVCTNPCTAAKDCADLHGTTCVAAGDVGAVAQCGGAQPDARGLCLPRCDDSACAHGQMCVASVCVPVPSPTARVTVDPRVRHQSLTGFGAAVAYSEQDITAHPKKDALYSALFAGLGLDVVRLRNRYGHPGDDDLSSAAQLVDAAKASLGRSPMVFMTSWSPPPMLKANGAVTCSGNASTCTLTKTTSGSFDYAAFAAYWRSALDAYAAAGVVPDYIGVQNNPNWVPSSSEVGEACRFLPMEGTANVPDSPSSVRYPGLAEAQRATLDALAGFAPAPKVLGPETSDMGDVAAYVAALDPSTLSAISHHLYDVDPSTAVPAMFTAVGELARKDAKPVFQTEMQADGLGTAVLIHYTTTVEGASAYLQSSLASSATGPLTNPQALVRLTSSDFTVQEPYYSMQHFALYTEPGWFRVDASVDGGELLASAWQSTSGDALTVILVNASTSDVDAQLELSSGDWPSKSRVVRTVFDGVERFTDLGRLSTQGIVRLPARSVATVAFTPG
jgi:glucuronoarabinoxylan endo-1,4-beta-xylanase